jgi:hypothetical protein
VPWQAGATRVPSASVSTQDAHSWSAKLPGALELQTGGGTHFTVAYVTSNPTGLSPAAVIADAMAWAKAHGYETVRVHDALTFMWGCGPSCHSTAALVDVNSRLAGLKYGLMEHLETRGLRVEKTLWGGTAHIETVYAAA